MIASEYASSPVAHPATQIRIGSSHGLPVTALHSVADALEGVRFAEEARDMDQQVVVESGCLAGGLLEVRDVTLHVIYPQQRHAPLQPADDRRGLVVREVDAAGREQALEHAIELVIGERPFGDSSSPGRRLR